MSPEAGSGVTASSTPGGISAATAAVWFLAVVAVVCPFASAFLSFLMPVLSICLIYAAFPIWLVMLVLFLVALFLRRWRTVVIFGFAGFLILLPYIGVFGPTAWLYRQGFRLHVGSTENYLSKCHLFDFVEGSIKQAIGNCEAHSLGAIRSIVFYDTSGQVAWPATRRTAAWNEAASHYYYKDVLAGSDEIAVHLVDNFYLVEFNTGE